MAKKVDTDVDIPAAPEPVGKPPPPTPPRAGKLTTQNGRAMSEVFDYWVEEPPPSPPAKKRK